MKLIFAKNIGFCSGVKRAVRIAQEALEKDRPPVQFLGSLVHNEKVIEKFKKKGVKFKRSPEEARQGTLIIQAHGFPPLSEKVKKFLNIRDATCPLVKKAQMEAQNFLKKGRQVIIIGDKNHSETKGIKARAGNAIIIETKKEASELSSKIKKAGIVAQTTQRPEEVKKIFKAIKKKVPDAVYSDTLCPEVQKRQKEIRKILKNVEGVLVIGSKKSANSTRLFQIAKKTKKPAWQINSLDGAKKIKFGKIPSLGIISGTSAPDWEIDKIKKYLKKAYGDKKKGN